MPASPLAGCVCISKRADANSEPLTTRPHSHVQSQVVWPGQARATFRGSRPHSRYSPHIPLLHTSPYTPSLCNWPVDNRRLIHVGFLDNTEQFVISLNV